MGSRYENEGVEAGLTGGELRRALAERGNERAEPGDSGRPYSWSHLLTRTDTRFRHRLEPGPRADKPTMQRYLLVPVVVALIGCAHPQTRVESWEGDKIEICGRNTQDADIAVRAVAAGCVEPKATGGRALTETRGATYHSTGYGHGYATPVRATWRCTTFQCKEPFSEPPH